MPLPWSCHFATVVYVCMLGHMNGFDSSAAGMAHMLSVGLPALLVTLTAMGL